MKKILVIACAAALIISFFSTYFRAQSDLQKSCESVTEDFAAIMYSYRHSFCLFEKLLQQEILNAQDPDEIEVFLKKQDKQLLAIEGDDYDGVYMYYQGRYLYSWDIPYTVYEETGYDATKRPWYLGAVAAGGEVFFSIPYPSYANDYMLATVSRLQQDGETVIAYDIKLGQIENFVKKLDLYNGALTLICDKNGNIIGSTDNRYQGGNYMLSSKELDRNVLTARQELDAASDDNAAVKAGKKLQCAQAQKEFCLGRQHYLGNLLRNEENLLFSLKDLSFGYAYSDEKYTCFVVVPFTKLLPQAVTLWAALSFLFTGVLILVTKMIGRSNQILTDVLTGLNNRRAFLRYCDSHMVHHPTDNLNLLMLDINEFKKINDRFGHVTGDSALLDTALVMKRACAESLHDFFLCRYGGDEFLLAGTRCSREDMEKTKKLIAQGLAAKNQSGSNPYTLEASMGISGGKCSEESDLERLLALADEAMYREKTGTEHRPAKMR